MNREFGRRSARLAAVGALVATGLASAHTQRERSPVATAQVGRERIVFIAGAFNHDLYALAPGEPDTTQQLSNTAGVSEADPDWAPDGETLAFVAPRGDGPVEAQAAVWLRDPEGAARALSFGPLDSAPDWHPDGRRLIFGSVLDPGLSTQTSVLLVAGLADGLNQQPLLAPLQRAATQLKSPAWSPDGTRVAFVVATDSGAGNVNRGGEIYIAGEDGRGAGILFAHPGWDDIEPAWSPDGRFLAFASGHLGAGAGLRHGLWLLDLTRGAFGEVLADDRLDLRHPTWSPDGQRLAFEARELGATIGALHITPLRDARLGDALAAGGAPDWTAGGTSLPTASAPPPTPTDGPSPTPSDGPAPTLTPPGGGPPGVPTVPPLAPFPTLPPAVPTLGPDAPAFPFATATPTPGPTWTPTPRVSPTNSPTLSDNAVLLPYLAQGAVLRPAPTSIPPPTVEATPADDATPAVGATPTNEATPTDTMTPVVRGMPSRSTVR